MAELDRTLVISKKEQMQALARQVSKEIFVADDLAEAVEMVDLIRPDLVVFDEHTAPEHIADLIKRRADKQPIPIVVMHDRPITKPVGLDTIEYIPTDCSPEALRQTICKIHHGTGQQLNASDLNRFYVDSSVAPVGMVGRSQAALEEFRLIKLVSASQCSPVLIIGETGTGKEVGARAIHLLRKTNEPFVAVNCAALTANLLESELFGHVKGAFTGADKDKVGLFELAGTGTIFLDEISEMPLDLQAKLLRVLQEKTFRRVGGIKEIPCQALIIASSNRQLKAEVEAGRFRRDLYYRLAVCPVTLSPLRSPKKRDDILVLSEYFLHTSSICPEKKGQITSLTKLAQEALLGHDWPGNIRELKNVIDRAIILENSNKLGLSSIVIDPERLGTIEVGSVCNDLKDLSLAKAEKELIARALKQTGWQKTQAASLLGITRATLYAKVKQYNIEPDPTVIRARRANSRCVSESQV